MACSIVARSINGLTDKALAFANAEARRTLEVGANWQTLAVFMTWALDCADAVYSGTPRLVWGLAAGSVNGYGAASAGHAVGIRAASADWTRAGTVPHHYYSFLTQAFVKVGASISAVGLTTQSVYVNSVERLNQSNCKRLFQGMVIAKGSPNFSVSRIHSLGEPQQDVTPALLIQAAEAGSITAARSVMGGTEYCLNETGSVPVDEAANGALDTLDLYWDKASRRVECHAVVVAKWA